MHKGSVRRVGAGAAIVALSAFVFVRIDAHAWDTSPLQQIVTAQDHQCEDADLQEGAIQGDVPKADQTSGRAQKGYNCGLELLGHTQLLQSVDTSDPQHGTRAAGNANMAWAGNCAYIAGSAGVNVAPQGKPSPPPNAGVAVVSVADDGTPTFLKSLRTPGSVATSETLNAITTPDGSRSILVVGQYGNDVISDPKPMDIYDVTDCTNPKLMTTYYWPENIHNLTITQDGKYVFATLPLEAVDISGLWATPPTQVKYLGDIEKAMAGPPVATGPAADLDDNLPAAVRNLTHPEDSSHEAWPKPGDDGTLYVGGQTPEFEIFSILDIHDWLQGKGKPQVISQESGRGHSVRTATIGGTPFILHSEESVFGAAYGCLPQETAPFAGPSQPYLTDIRDPVHPKTVAEFGLQINEPANCPEQLQAKENDSVHYHDVDNAANTTFVMASMWNAGLRVFDVRTPTHPTEVAYFNTADVDPTANVDLDHAWGHSRYLPDKGQIWFGTADGGFWVVGLGPKLRAHLGLDQKNASEGITTSALALKVKGHPGTLGASLQRPPWGYIDIGPYYCAFKALGAPIKSG